MHTPKGERSMRSRMTSFTERTVTFKTPCKSGLGRFTPVTETDRAILVKHCNMRTFRDADYEHVLETLSSVGYWLEVVM